LVKANLSRPVRRLPPLGAPPVPALAGAPAALGPLRLPGRIQRA
jgi:hypothetical protein